MSKKCCGFIYSDEEQICRICGSELIDEEQQVVSLDTVENVGESDQSIPEIFANDKIQEDVNSISDIQQDVEEQKNMMDILDEVVAEEEAAAEAKIKPGEEKATASIKVVGIISMILAVLGIAMAGICVYFMMIKPAYDKSDVAGTTLIFPEISTNSDIEISAPRDYISTVPLATSTDLIYVPVNPDIEETETTEADATATDVEETTESEVAE